MTDYGEEQRNELEALESIYPDSFTGDFRGRVPAAVRAGVGWAGAAAAAALGLPGHDGGGTARPRGHLSRPSLLQF